MPATPIVENLAQDIEDTLNGVKIANGYSVDLTAQRRRRFGNNPADGLCVIFQGAAQNNSSTTGGSAGIIYWTIGFVLQVYVVDSGDSDNPEPIDRRINYVRSDVEKSLMLDPHRGGHTHDTMLHSCEPFDEGENGYSGFLLVFDCAYATAETDPTLNQA